MAFENVVVALQVRPQKRRSLASRFRLESESDSLILNASRLIGRPLEKGILVSASLRFKTSDVDCRLYRLRMADDVLVLSWKPTSSDTKALLESVKIRNRWLQSQLQILQVQPSLDSAVDPVVGVVGGPSSIEKLPVEWIKLESRLPADRRFVAELSVQLAARVAIERSLLQWATQHWDKTVLSILRTPISSSLTRRWPVELLSDREHLSSAIRGARFALNLAAVRAEVLDRAKSWWSVLGFLVGILTLLFGLLQK